MDKWPGQDDNPLKSYLDIAPCLTRRLLGCRCVNRHGAGAHSDVVDYIEMFYNSLRRHGFNEMLSPVEYEKKFKERLLAVQDIESDSCC